MSKAKKKRAGGELSKSFYGSVLVGERGQVVIPKQARDELGIKQGDKLIVLGNPARGIALVKADLMREFAEKVLKSI